MTNRIDGSLFGVIFMIPISIVVFGFGMHIKERSYQQEAIKRGYAQHNSQTGKWEWIEPKSLSNQCIREWADKSLHQNKADENGGYLD